MSGLEAGADYLNKSPRIQPTAPDAETVTLAGVAIGCCLSLIPREFVRPYTKTS
jgi:hypothetical protein